MKVLSVNAGSSTLKFRLYEMPEETVLMKGTMDRIGLDGSNLSIRIGEEKIQKDIVLNDHEDAVNALLKELLEQGVINSVTNMPVIRPVACLDKLEIIDIAKKIDTYDISILPFEDCCTIFVPKHPVINPNLQECLINEEKFDYNKMIEDTVNNVMTITITENMEKEFNNLL